MKLQIIQIYQEQFYSKNEIKLKTQDSCLEQNLLLLTLKMRGTSYLGLTRSIS